MAAYGSVRKDFIALLQQELSARDLDNIADDFGVNAGFGARFSEALTGSNLAERISTLVLYAMQNDEASVLLETIHEWRPNLPLPEPTDLKSSTPPLTDIPAPRVRLTLSRHVLLIAGAGVLVVLLLVVVLLMNGKPVTDNPPARTALVTIPTTALLPPSSPTSVTTLAPIATAAPALPKPTSAHSAALTLAGTYTSNGGMPGQARRSLWSPTGNILATVSGDSILQFWQADGLSRGEHKITGQVTDIAWSANGQFLATVEATGLISAWTPEGTAAWSVKAGEQLTSVAWSPNDALVAVGTLSGNVLVVLAETHTLVATLRGHKSYITGLAWSLDSAVLASGSNDKTARLWPIRKTTDTPKPSTAKTPTASYEAVNPIVLQNHSARVDAVLWSPDGKMLTTTYSDGIVELYDLNGNDIGRLDNVVAAPIAWADPQHLLWVDEQATNVYVWDVGAKAVSDTWPGCTVPIKDVAWSPNGKLVAISTGATIAICSADKTMTLHDTLPGKDMADMLWSADSTTLLVRYSGATADIWRVVP